ncbi:MAG: cellobiose phosphorylase, partial [Candidatus Omnitrophica bacterium]|nr:cellobiose phosphorylase [Candidatus Omnitrophota bacterium]
DNAEVVQPRKKKYVLLHGQPKQLHSLAVDPGKKEMIAKRPDRPHLARADYGKGAIYFTSLVNKLACILANKLSSLDPSGVGIEMESNKPNWFDALNGLPALFGSSLCETWELKRLVIFIKEAFKATSVEKVYLSEEIRDFIANLGILLEEYLGSKSEDRDFQYWDKSYTLKEAYREKTKFGFSGKEAETDAEYFISILDRALSKIDAGIAKALNKKNNTYNSYFINEVVKYEQPEAGYLKPVKFSQKPLPLFLEGQMHALRLTGDINTAKAIYKATKASVLYDKELKMYKVTASLLDMPEEIGRCRVFTPGWLEHESIWLHMEYKYLLEILKHGLYEEFYEEFKNTLVCFQKPQDYGRSILENSSFIVSSAFPDKKLRGNGFVARLSGSTAEFIHIWLTMNLGARPFILNESKELNLMFNPVLAGWLFDRKGQYAFNFLSLVRVTYHNPKRKDTFGKNGAKINRISFAALDGKTVELDSGVIPAPFAGQIRERKIKQIDIYLE